MLEVTNTSLVTKVQLVWKNEANVKVPKIQFLK